MKNKSEALDKFRKYKVLVEIQTGNHIKPLQSNPGREYMNTNFDLFLNEHGIVSQLIPLATQESNLVGYGSFYA